MTASSNNQGIAVSEERCTGCLRCELECSFIYAGSYNPSRSAIKIAVDDISGKPGAAIVFTENCKGCGACVEACLYGALQAKPRGKKASTGSLAR